MFNDTKYYYHSSSEQLFFFSPCSTVKGALHYILFCISLLLIFFNVDNIMGVPFSAPSIPFVYLHPSLPTPSFSFTKLLSLFMGYDMFFSYCLEEKPATEWNKSYKGSMIITLPGTIIMLARKEKEGMHTIFIQNSLGRTRFYLSTRGLGSIASCASWKEKRTAHWWALVMYPWSSAQAKPMTTTAYSDSQQRFHLPHSSQILQFSLKKLPLWYYRSRTCTIMTSITILGMFEGDQEVLAPVK